MLLVSDFEPTESFFFVTQGSGNSSDQRCRDVSLLPCLDKLSENVSRFGLPAHPGIGDGQAATRQMRCLLGFGVERNRFRKIVLLAIGGSQNRIQIKVIWIELERSLTFHNRVIDAVVG